jgi:hypothetical protein
MTTNSSKKKKKNQCKNKTVLEYLGAPKTTDLSQRSRTSAGTKQKIESQIHVLFTRVFQI